ncbi:hypothetical protein BD309DRAFT_974372 [Dichomitus squalens]|uniref:Uncharacterized protein n=1 Tax=Dichomitus squalens TaxID=114155 RepID=A0A4Q9PGZ6_9APHY|nr:hypothetical protein BD309DRAFT_974372 [Dichomitus squalens]TBU53895.1 hypothetical protein BD310DRAFT_937092 [Dichomitus squalens]
MLSQWQRLGPDQTNCSPSRHRRRQQTCIASFVPGLAAKSRPESILRDSTLATSAISMAMWMGSVLGTPQRRRDCKRGSASMQCRHKAVDELAGVTKVLNSASGRGLARE